MKREEAALFATVDELPQFKDKKKKQQEQQEEEEKVVLNDDELLDQCAPDELDELIDRLRIKFADRTDLTPVNPETFAVWMEKREAEKAAKAEEKLKKKLKKKGKQKGLTGRELFMNDSSIFKDDENAADMTITKDEPKSKDADESKKDDSNVAAVEDVDADLFMGMDD